MSYSIDFLTLYINKLGVCEYADSNTTLFENLITQKTIENIHVDQLFKGSRFHTPIIAWLQNGNNQFWEDVIYDVFKSYVLSIQPIKTDTIVAAVTIRTSIVTHKIDQLKYQYKSALENANVGLWVWIDTDNGHSWWSDSFLALLGYVKGDIEPGFQTMIDLIHPDHLESFMNVMKTFYETKDTYTNFIEEKLEVKMRTKSGAYKHLLFTSKSVKEDSVLRFSGTVVDIDVLKSIEDKLVQREAQLTLSMEAGNMGTWSWDIQTNNVVWSDYVLEIFGLQKDEFKGDYESYLNLIPEEERASVKGAIEKALTDEHGNFSYEHSIYLSDKSKRLLFCKGKVDRLKGMPVRMTGVVLDITRENELKTLLGQTKERYKAVIEAMSEGVIIIDLVGKILDHNTAATTIIGYDNAVLTGNDFSFGEGVAIKEDFTPFPMDEFPGIRTLYTGLAYKNITLGWIKPSKEVVWLSINSEPVLDEFGRQVAVVCSYSDVTDRYISLNNLKIKNRQLEDFAHITSHNLRSPISNLSILLDYFETSKNETERNEYFQNLKHVSANLLSTIQVLAESLKIQKDFVDDECIISFQEMFNNVVTLLSGQVKEADMQIDVDFSNCPTIYYSPTYLQSIFINLLSNAIKYRSSERRSVIKIETYFSEKQETVLSIFDNGIGIDLEKHKHKIFGLYKTFHVNKDSRGVGLYMTKRQVETLGGSISVESEIDRGTTFKVIF
ncbi:PAS domain-containing sensor histidine kinase [Cytophaga aurantiaca]|uniref:PAS domain-containing sensor histidine kinase n=1 Tax=Cytophaga aurantiaca TaxID=29530 RepID=UPI0003781F5B|nr:PAS domain-containing sensor histidine kinase [Cytophaga aurantiaca]